MPSVAAALFAMAVQRPITDTGIWLDRPPLPGTVVTAPLRLAGETQAPEGVLSVRLYVVRGTTSTEVASYAPLVPGVGTVPFAFAWSPSEPGSYTVRVVSTTALRGFSAEVTDLVVPAAPARPVRVTAPRPAARVAVAPRPSASRHYAVRRVPRLDDSGRAFGKSAPMLPYAPPVVLTRRAPVREAFAPAVPVADRRGWVSFAGGLLVLLVCSHLHRSLRPQPDPRGTS
jgi:hypothetical protein